MDELLELLTSIRDNVEFESNDALIDDGYLDSFDIIEIVAAISDKYDIEIPATQITPSNFNSAESMLNMINRLIEY